MGSLAVGSQVRPVADVVREPRLRRLELAWCGSYVGEWVHFVALSIYAYDNGGATAVGVFGLIRMAAAAVALPFGSMLTDRYPRQRVLLGVHAARAAVLGMITVALVEDAPRALVFALAALAAVVASPTRPATMSLVPLLARTPEELVAANVCSSAMEGLGTLAGPLLGGVVTATASTAAAVGLGSAVHLGCVLAVLRIHREGDVALRSSGGGMQELARGFRTLTHDPNPRFLVSLFASQTVVRGLLNVLLTVAALGVLGVGQSGVGWLNATLGAGALAGGAATLGLVGRRRLAVPLALALVLWGAPIAVIGAWPNAAAAFVCLAVVGLGNALLDVAGITLLQRAVDDHVLGRVFGAFELLAAAGIAIGSGLGSVAVDVLGIRGALVASGLILPVLALASVRRLRAIDDASTVPLPQLDLVSELPLFAPLPATTLERLAFRMDELRLPAGTTIVSEGEWGDRFYVVALGDVDVVRAGAPVRTLHAGDYFGEIALLRDVPRTATCTARTDVVLYGVDRETFVAAVSGDLRATAAAAEAVAERIAADRQLDAVAVPGETA